MIKVGLTGGIGSGKSTVADMFQDLDVPVFTADIEAKKILNRPEIAKQVADLFNLQLNHEGRVNRAEIASIVFNDKQALDKLNSIIHPEVHKSFESWFEQQSGSYVIYEAAIIFEKNRASYFDFTILVTAPKELRIKRVMERDHTDSTAVESRMKAQWPESKKKKLADFEIVNINLNETQQQVNKLHEKFLRFSDK